MDAIWEKLYYRLQSAFIFVQKKRLGKQLGLSASIDYRIDLIRTLHPIKGRIPTSSAFIDIGTNEGEFSQIFSHVYHPSLLICVEPNDQLNDRIKINTKGYNPVIINKAISDKETEMDFYIHPDSQMSSLFQSNEDLMKRDFVSNNSELIIKKTIPVTTLDMIFQQYSKDLAGKIIFLKIDTQGNELEVINGGNKALAAIHYCLLEYMFQSPYEKQYPFEEIIALMDGHNFSCFGPMHISYRATGEVGAVLFLFGKKESA